MSECYVCGSDDTVLYPAEDSTERDVVHCYICGHDQQVKP